MSTHTLPKQLGDLLLVEVTPGWTKQKGLLLLGAVYALGTVLALVDGKYQALDPVGEGAAEKAVAVLGENVDASAADTSGVVIARGAVVDSAELLWPAGITDAEKAIALDQLNALGIVAHAAL